MNIYTSTVCRQTLAVTVTDIIIMAGAGVGFASIA